MTMTCTVCRDARRQEIDFALIEGKSSRVIARQIGGPAHDAINRHRRCIRKALLEAKTHKTGVALEHGLWLVSRLRALAETCEPMPRQFIEAADALNRSLRTLGLLNGEIVSPNVTAFLVGLGAASEGEVRSALATVRAGSAVSLDDLYLESVEGLRFVLAQRPDLRESALRALAGEVRQIESTNGGEP